VIACTKSALRTSGLSALFLILSGGIFLSASKDPLDTLARLRGESISISPTVADLGDGIARQMKEFPLQLTNRSKKPIRIIGGTATCNCIATSGLPVSLGPGESCTVLIGVRFQGSPGSFRHDFVFYTDDDKQGMLIARFAGRIVQ